MSVGARLEQLRRSRNMTQTELSKILNTTQSNIGHWENNRRNIPSDKLLDIANCFNVSVDYLLGHETPDQPTDLKQIIRNQSMTFDGKPLSDRDVAVIESFLKTLKSE